MLTNSQIANALANADFINSKGYCTKLLLLEINEKASSNYNVVLHDAKFSHLGLAQVWY